MRKFYYILFIIGLFACESKEETVAPLPVIEQLTHHNENVSQVRISEDGNTILYTISKDHPVDGSQVTDLYVMNSDGSNQRKLLTHPGFFDQAPVISKDGKTVAFGSFTFSNRGNYAELILIGTDGTNKRSIVTAPGSMAPSAFVNNDASLVYGKRVSTGECSCNTVWTVNLDGSDDTFITYGATAHMAPGNTFMITDDFPRDSYYMDLEGKQPVVLPRAIPWRISPLNTEILMRKQVPHLSSGNSNTDPLMQVFIVNTNGTGFKQLTNTLAQNYPLDFFPDGKRILFRSYDSSGATVPSNLYAINTDGSDMELVAEFAYGDATIGFLEKKPKILFTSRRDGHNNLYIYNIRE